MAPEEPPFPGTREPVARSKQTNDRSRIANRIGILKSRDQAGVKQASRADYETHEIAA